MAKQFSYHATDSDVAAIQVLLVASGDVDVLSDTATDDLADLLPLERLAIPVSAAGQVSLTSYLAPKSLPRRVILKRLSPVKTHVDLENSHLIELIRPYYTGPEMRWGRLYFHNRVFVDGKWVAKDPAFCKWADGVMTRVRKSLRYDGPSVYTAKAAAAAFTAGTLKDIS
jgi:hypothetical protein